MIQLKNLSKRYGEVSAVNNLSLAVSAGEIFGFLGVNGAGKTTTLRMITGVLRPTAGEIYIGGVNLADEPERAKAMIGYIPDRPYLYNRLTAREYLSFVCDLHSVAENEAERKISELLRDYGLVEWQNELVEGFSHGMKQRLAICAALVHSPKVLVVDEPMVGLDPHGAKLLKDNFRRYARAGMAILLSTHSLSVAEEVADRLAIIHQGVLIKIGSLTEIREELGAHDRRLEEIFLQLTWSASDTTNDQTEHE